MRAEIPGLNQPAYDGMSQPILPQLQPAPGFISHAAHPSAGGWTVIEVWESQADWDRWFQNTIQPAAQQAGLAEPRIETVPLHHFVKR